MSDSGLIRANKRRKTMHKHGGDVYRNVGVIDYSANINLKGMPESVIDAACQGVKMSFNYPDVECEELRKALEKEEGVPAEYIRCGNGAADIIFGLVYALKPKKALLLAPSFYEYEQALRAAGCEVEYYYLKEETGFIPDRGLIDAIKNDTDILFVCNPNNPTGVLSERDFLSEMVERCRECGTYMILDECFIDLTGQQDKYTLKEWLKVYDRLVILKAFTKLYSMPGLRLGYGLCRNKDLMDLLRETSQPWNVSLPAQMAGLAALKEKEFVTASLAEIVRQKERLVSGLKEMGIKVYGCGANYIFFKAPEDFGKKCLERKIMIRDCGNYVGLKKGFYRIAVKDEKDNEVLLKVFREVL